MGPKIKQMINCLLVFFPTFGNSIRTKSKFQVIYFCHNILDNYIKDNCELLSKFNNNQLVLYFIDSGNSFFLTATTIVISRPLETLEN